ncbi:MAG: hypothetical protein HY452_01515 [Parcubacteria group bacterium]|nr:hypothetical protein [Parcubacteria group bacterium]
MATKTQTRSKTKEDIILDEIKLLREQVLLLLPQEDLNDYIHPQRIKKTYAKAIKKYPPLSQ